MATLPIVQLKPGDVERVLAGHPWIYEGSLVPSDESIGDGAVVEVQDPRGKLLGLGFFNSRSRIRVRIVSRTRETVNTEFFERRIAAAWALRKRWLPHATACRVINAESDFLPGLIVDRYEDVLVLQISSLGMDQRRAQIVEALQRVLSPRCILERSESGARRLEGLDAVEQCLVGESSALLETVVGGLTYRVPWKAAHKTGVYLDQQMNQVLVGQWAKDRDVLDTFTFVGGFALQAAAQGARSVVGIDQSLEAVTAARLNAERNGLSSKVRFEVGNVFDWLKGKSQSRAGREKGGADGLFDLIILDPPSFTRTRSAVPDALRGYKEIHLRAMKLLRPGGVLASFCCSHHVPGSLFDEVIHAAAFDCRRVFRRVAVYNQPPDHPVLTSVPETEYLKGFAYEWVD